MKKNRIVQICKQCKAEFIHKRNSIVSCCSDGCRKLYLKSDVIYKLRQKNAQLAIKKKYGVDNYFQSDDFIKKAKKTKLKRYGNENFVNVEKAKKTKFNKYGDSNYNNTELNKDTKLINHGDENYNNRDSFKQTMKKEYGGIGFQIPAINASAKGSMMEKYGVEYGMQSSKIQNIIKKSMMKKYGTEHYLSSDEYKHANFLKRLNAIKSILQRNGIELVGDFTKTKIGAAKIDYTFLCNVCNTKFTSNFSNGHLPMCPKCNKVTKYVSIAEKELSEFLALSMPVENIIRNSRSIIPGKELDIYIPSKKIAVEFNGNYYHSELAGKKDKNYHLNKLELCIEAGIRLIQIFEDEWYDNCDIVKNRLLHIFGIENKVKNLYARNCTILDVCAKEKNEFLESTHIQGKDNSTINIGLYHNSQLVALCTFSKPRIIYGKKSQDTGVYELVRFSCNQTIAGGFGKLISHFIKKYDPSKIISYVDRRWNDGKSYEKLGFQCVKETVPNYWYINKKNYLKRYYRFNFRKDALKNLLEKYDPVLSEWENMQLNGYDRIWDCGSLKYEWKNKRAGI